MTLCYGLSVLLHFFITRYISTSRTLLSKTDINSPIFSSLLPNPCKPQHCKLYGNTLCSCTKISPTKQSVSQNFFHLTFILVHILIFILVLLTHIFLIFKRNSLSNNTLTFPLNSIIIKTFSS